MTAHRSINDEKMIKTRLRSTGSGKVILAQLAACICELAEPATVVEAPPGDEDVDGEDVVTLLLLLLLEDLVVLLATKSDPGAVEGSESLLLRMEGDSRTQDRAP